MKSWEANPTSTHTMFNLGWFSTGRGPGSRSLLSSVHQAITDGRIKARISFIFSNRAPGEHEGSDQFFSLANSFGLTVIHHSSRAFRRNWTGDSSQWRAAYDVQVSDLIAPFSPDLCVLAGYMLIVSPPFCCKFAMLNLHPAAPHGPEGTWQEIIWQLIHQRATHSGVKIHLVTEELDRGPTITHCHYPIRGKPFNHLWNAIGEASAEDLRNSIGEDLPLFQTIRTEGVKRELPLLVETLASLSHGDIQISHNNPSPPQDLTPQIESAISPA